MDLVNFYSHVASMNEHGRTLSGFNFVYNKHECVAVLSTAEQDLCKDREAICMLKVFKDGNLEECFECFCRTRWLNIPNPIDLYRFFEIDRSTSKENHFKDLIKSLLGAMEERIPANFKNTVKKDVDRAILKVIETDPTDPNKKYCFAVKVNGLSKTGSQIYRSDYNDEKTRRLRPDLYKIFGIHKDISFSYSDDPNKTKTDWEILHNFNKSHNEYKL
ncbi:DUF6037 family protein [Enterococcus hirae]|uniref:DUF6037 family protein n=1 Tax=Enterococcus hirae TaxID=1354 RepID=UPI0039A43551